MLKDAARIGTGVVFGAALVLLIAPSGSSTSDSGPRRPEAFDPSRSYAPLVDAVDDAVVSIEVTGHRDVAMDVPPMFREFFPGFPQGPREFDGEGSGFLISADGLVLTNHHVVGEADTITVKLADGGSVEATLLGSDPRLDVALLQLPQDREWPWVELGSSEAARVGDRVVAVGNPLGLGHTVTVGILSGKGRPSGHSAYQDFLQTDAAINPGNSGGPLFDLDGHVIGMNTAIIAGANTVGFAVPSDAIRAVLDDLREDGRVRRGYLGVSVQDLDDSLRDAWDVEADGGVVVADVQIGLPAEDAGVEVGDVVTAVNGVEVDSTRQFVQTIGGYRAGDEVRLSVVRQGKDREIQVTLAERTDDVDTRGPVTRPSAHQGSLRSDLGFEAIAVPRSLAAQRGVDGGVLVESVTAGSPAALALEAGDIILRVNQNPVGTPDDLEFILERSAGTISMLVLRDDQRRFVVLRR